MAIVAPFTALRFSDSAGDLKNLTAPPYDVLSPTERNQYAEKSPYNTVWLTLPERLDDDRSQFVRYARSAARLADWKQEGILKTETEPSIYRYRQAFVHPITGQQLNREQTICLIKVEPYENGIVLPHEQTFPKHKEDRLRLLEATRTHLECIYGLYQDAQKKVSEALENALFAEIAKVETNDGVIHQLERCTDDDSIAAFINTMQNEKVWIADGHHRYETALNFRQQLGHQTSLIAEDFMMIALSPMHDPGLIILPTHRILKGEIPPRPEIETKLRVHFNVRAVGNNALPEEVRTLERPETRVFGIVLPPQSGYLAVMAEPEKAATLVETEGSIHLRSLDVSILHDLIIKKVFGVEGTDRLEYTRDAEEAIERVESGEASAAFISNPPSVEDMRAIAQGGEKMPQKSTYYYPKLLSGLVFWSLSDFRSK